MPGVDLVERRRRLVEVVEGGHALETGRRRVAGRPEVDPPERRASAGRPRRRPGGRGRPARGPPPSRGGGAAACSAAGRDGRDRARGEDAPARDVRDVPRGGRGAAEPPRRRRGGTLAVALSTSVGSGVSGVSTDALTGTHTPYCGFRLTEDLRSSAVIAFWVAAEPACWTASATAACALLYGVGVREVIWRGR